MAAKKKKHPKPVHVRPRIGLDKSLSKRLDTSQEYIAGQAAGDTNQALATQAQALSTARKMVVDTQQKRTNLLAALDAVQTDLVVAIDVHDFAMRDYAEGAAKYCGSDASLLAKLGVQAASKPGSSAPVAVAAPAKVSITPGAAFGEALVKCGTVAGAAAYVFEFQLESALPTDPWIQAALTKHASAVVTGLAQGQHIRVRVRAVGTSPGPWSAVVVGAAL
jgi:hypothetical protein